MRRLFTPLALAGLLLLVLTGSGPIRGRATTVGRDTAAAAVARSTLAFQPDDGARFVARGPGYGVALAPDEVTVAGASTPTPLRMRLAGGRPDAAATGQAPLAGRVNLLLGDDPSRWRTDVPTFARVAYSGVWEGVDVVYHGRGSRLEQDFVVAPGADPGAIGLSFTDARALRLADGGDLVVALPGGEVRLARPDLYQDVDGRRRPVAGGFAVDGGDHVGFRVGPYDRARPLVIDPVLVDSTYLGGSSTDSAYGVAVDDGGNVYVTGFTESTDFPTSGPQQAALVQVGGVRTDAFVAKLNPAGNGFVYSTFLGGRGRDTGYGIAVGSDGSAYVAGYTESPDFPLARPIQKAFGGGPSDAFLAKLGPQGAVLQYSTFIGGSGNDGARGVAVDQAGDAYVVGATSSGDFPTAGPPLRAALDHPDDSDAFVTRVNAAGTAWTYSTYLGGKGADHALAVAIDGSGHAYVTGDTHSPDYPTGRNVKPVPGGGPPADPAANPDAFVSKLAPDGSSLVFSTFLGGSESDQGTGIAVDSAGAAYVTGSTGSINFPVIKGVQGRKNGDFDAFVTKFAAEGPVVWSTYLGGSTSDGGAAVTVDRSGQASVTGAAASADFPTVKPFQTARAGGFVDAFVSTFSEDGSALVQSSYLGGRDEDQGTAIAADKDGGLVVAGYTNSADFPTAKPFQAAKGGGVGDAFVAKVGTAAASPSERATASPARERRIRLFLGVTAALLLAAVGQTLWLRRRPAPGPPVPAGAGGLAVPVPQPGWYRRATGVRVRDIEIPAPPIRPRAVPTPSTRGAGAARGAEPPADEASEVAVPDLLPEEDKGLWTGPAPADDTELWAPETEEAAEAAEEAEEAEEAAAEPDHVPPPPEPVDVLAPDLWRTAEPEPDLDDDSAWWDLLAADPAELPPLPAPRMAETPAVPAAGGLPEPAEPVAAEAAFPAPEAPSAQPEAPAAETPPALAAAAPTPPPTPAAETPPPPPPSTPVAETPPPPAPLAETPSPPSTPPPPPPPPTTTTPAPAPTVPPTAAVPAAPALPEPPSPAPPPPGSLEPGGPIEVFVGDVGPPPPEPPVPTALPESQGQEEVASAADGWTAELWARGGADAPAPPEVEATPGVEGGADDEAAADEDEVVSVLVEPPGARPAPPEPAAVDDDDERLSIGDLLDEEFPIPPPAEDEGLSMWELLAEDLPFPDSSPRRPAVPGPPSPPPPPPPMTPTPDTDDGLTAGEGQPDLEALAPAAEELPPAQPPPDETPPETDEPPVEGQGVSDEAPPGSAASEPGSSEPAPPPKPRPSRPLPEAAPGRSLGGRLRRAWEAQRRE